MQNCHKAQQQKRPQTDAKWAQSCEATTTRHKTTNEKLKCTTETQIEAKKWKNWPQNITNDHKLMQNYSKEMHDECNEM